MAKGLEIDFETYKREGKKNRPDAGISRVYIVFFRKGKEVIETTVLTATDGKLSVPDMISDADDFIGINIQKIFIELFEKIDA